MIVIVDYGMGNLRSVQKAAGSLGTKTVVSSSVRTVQRAQKIIFPGVGHFGKAVKELKRRKLFSLLKEKISQGTPFLGICLGMHLLLQESEEAPGVKGLGVIEGKVKRFPRRLIVPHMGWNQLIFAHKAHRTPLFKGIKTGTYCYFAHSYYSCPRQIQSALTMTEYGGKEFVSSLYTSGVWGIQFHPEKSQALGLRILKNFLRSC